MKIKVKLFNEYCRFQSIKKGEWIDLKASSDVVFTGPSKTKKEISFQTGKIPLGIGMKLPEGYEAIIAPRSSTLSKYGIMLTNSIGIIDSSYSGPNDQWQFPFIAMQEGHVFESERICQFRIQLSQKATMWQKIKWLFTNKIKFEFVKDYEGEDRGGFGSTGKY